MRNRRSRKVGRRFRNSCASRACATRGARSGRAALRRRHARAQGRSGKSGDRATGRSTPRCSASMRVRRGGSRAHRRAPARGTAEVWRLTAWKCRKAAFGVDGERRHAASLGRAEARDRARAWTALLYRARVMSRSPSRSDCGVLDGYGTRAMNRASTPSSPRRSPSPIADAGTARIRNCFGRGRATTDAFRGTP